MFQPSDSFPYIGLRPFSEEDSLYFKGREEHIHQITALLEMNKFLMVTGASGDGKSSLVYAGLVPNARAGFFRARYANWIVADFRPERSPLQNLARTVSRSLRIGHEDSVEVELRRGFSSLVELYTSSSLYIDEGNETWMGAAEEHREDMQRKAANLLIVADQFEEFFTNPENYYRNAPSADSQLVINLLLETARISIEKNLPIYIVCTMRSDYIGQCAAFRGLPEFIGFSQFFVPRLKRKELIQVVKEPAYLHGDKISDRLVERVVYDLGEGIDQLPVLEHAMNEVWIQAKNGEEELDLIHYAKAGGMAADELPAENRAGFAAWFGTLPPMLQQAYQVPGLSRIIDTHANKLYFSAADHYNLRHNKKINTEDAQLIIKVAFTCLTKMDEGRAVRNRMTLQEITDILARPGLTWEVVGGVLNIFREPGNTFLRPYITDDPESHVLQPGSVLDITHESLIRNWELLLSWAREEYDHLVVYQDFKKQLDRWIDSSKSRGFLLPIGPLTFFETWHGKLKPNRYWINRYLDPGIDRDTRLREAGQTIENAEAFLRSSSRKVRVTRLIVRYGAMRIVTIVGLFFILGLCAFYYRDAREKENANVLSRILKDGRKFMADPRFDTYTRADFMIMSEFMAPGSFKSIMDEVPVDQQFDLIRSTYWSFMYLGGNPKIRTYIFHYGDSLLKTQPLKTNDPRFLMERLKALNILVMTTSHYLYFHEDSGVETVLKNALRQTAAILPLSFGQQFAASDLKLPFLDDGMENVLNFNTLTKEEILLLLQKISPFESKEAKASFDSYFPLEGQVLYSRREQVKHNGGYQQLAYLYGSVGQVSRVKSCIDTLIKYHPNYGTFRNNILNIATYLFKAGYKNETDDLLEYYASRQKVSKKELYELWLTISGILDRHLAWKIGGENHNANIELMDPVTVNQLFDQYHTVLKEEYKDGDALNFNLALYCKQRGLILSKIDADKGHNGFDPDSLFARSLEFYRKVSAGYLGQSESVYAEDLIFGNPVKQSRRRNDLFLYPDHFPKVTNPRSGPARYFSGKFLNYLLGTGQFSSLYSRPGDFRLLKDWIFTYNRFNKPNYFSRLNRNYTPLGAPMLAKIDSLASAHPLAAGLNWNLVRLLLIDEYISTANDEQIEKIFQKLELERIREDLREGSQSDQEVFAFRLERLSEYFALHGRRDDAFRVIRSQTSRTNIIKGYATAPLQLLRSRSGPREDAYTYLDSAVTEFDRTRDFRFFTTDPRIAIVLASSQIGGKDMNDLARRYTSKIALGEQSGVVQELVVGISLSGDYYKAFASIPDFALIERLFYFNMILSAEGLKRSEDPEWKTYFDSFQNYWIWDVIGYEAEIF